MTEFPQQQQIRLEAARQGTPLLRNNNGALLDTNGRMVRYGLGNDSKRLNEVFKSSDLIGIRPLLIRPEHVGKTIGQFFAVEVKKPGWSGTPRTKHELAQAAFGRWVIQHGGYFQFATGTEEIKIWQST